MNVGIIGPGKIARKMADTINKLGDFTNYAVASRTLKKAEEFKEEFGFVKAYGSYGELINDPNVDLVYIATPHSCHSDQMLMCLKANKPVLCEKTFTTSSKDTRYIYNKFEEKKLYVAEALWTSFMPSRDIIKDLIDKGDIGKVTSMEAYYEVSLMHKERVRLRSLGGGAAMDIGLYAFSFVLRTLGFKPDKVEVVKLDEIDDIDVREVVEFTYGDVKATCYVDGSNTNRSDVIIHGNKGEIVINSVNNPGIIEVKDKNGIIIKRIECEPSYGGFEFQLIETKNSIQKGLTEPKSWTHANSIKLSEILDIIVYK